MKKPPAIDQAVKNLAKSHAGVATSVACAGTALEATTFDTGGKAFLFSRAVQGGHELRLKLEASRRDIEKLAKQWPASYSIGAGGWAKLIISEERSLPLVADWIAESYALIGGAKKPAAKKPAAKQAAAKKPAAKKPAAKKPAAKKPAAKKPAKKPAAKKPATKKPAKKR